MPKGFDFRIIASGLGHPTGIAFDGLGNMYVENAGAPPFNFQENTAPDGAIIKIYPGGGNQTVIPAGTLANPYGLVLRSGSMFISDSALNNQSRVLKVNSLKSVHTLASLPYPGSAEGIALDKSGNILVSGGRADKIFKISPTGSMTTLASVPGFVEGLAFDPRTNTTFAGLSGNDLIPGTGSVIKVAQNGTMSTLVTGLQAPTGMAVGKGGHFGRDLYVANAAKGQILKVNPTGGVTIFASGFSQPDPTIQYDIYRPFALVFDKSGNMFGTDFVGGYVFEISSAQTSTP